MIGETMNDVSVGLYLSVIVSLNFSVRSISTGVDFGFPLTHHLVFFIIGLIMIICFVIGVFTPRSLDKQPKACIDQHGDAEVGAAPLAAAVARYNAIAVEPSSLQTPHPPSYPSEPDTMRQCQ